MVSNILLKVMCVVTFSLVVNAATAAIALDRTRVIVSEEGTTLTIRNENQELPYLAQGWIEDADGHKIDNPLIVLPPIQRIEAGAKGQMKVQPLSGIASLPKDKESLFYFNLREIPPRPTSSNTLQVALQTRVKLFFRPKGISPSKIDLENPWQERLTLTRLGSHYIVNNPTPFYITLAAASASVNGLDIKGFSPLMVPPKGQAQLGGDAETLGFSPVITYINDYGGRPQMTFSCSGNNCKVISLTKG